MRRRRKEHRPLDQRIGLHDRHQLELKIEYLPEATKRESRYEVETFVFIPSSLNINSDTVPAQKLFRDIHNYVRLKTPELTWSELVALPHSPLVRAAFEAQNLDSANYSRFAYECKLFACVFRKGLHDLAEKIGLTPRAAVPELTNLVGEYLDGANLALGHFRKLGALTERPHSPERARAAFRLADEFASLSVEQSLRKALVDLDTLSPEPSPLKKSLLETMLAEERYRLDCRYPSILDPEGDNEAYVYRSGLLKKFCSSALFLHIHRLGARRRWQELLFAISAGVAMAFATVVAFWAQGRAGLLGTRLFLVLVIAYMFKDRIKEGMRALFAKLLERHLYDRKIAIDDPAGGILGTCREKIEYVKDNRLPAEVLAVRQAKDDPLVRFAEAEREETIYRYKKEIVLDAERLHNRPDGAGVTDIVRFNIARVLRDMDEPFHVIDWIDADTHRVGPISGAKVYHVDVVLRFRAHRDSPPTTTMVRLVMDRRGIKRIER